MSGPKRNPDKLNSIGVVVVGICGAVLVYVSIVALQAFYMNDSSEIQNMQDYGGQDTTFKSIRTEQVGHLEGYAPNAAPAPTKPGDPPGVQTYRVPIERAIKLVVESAKVDPSSLVPTQGRSDKATIQPIFGRPNLAPPPAPSPAGTVPEGSGAAPGPADAVPAGSGSAAVPGVTPPLTPTGGQGPGGGAPPGTHGEAIKGAGSNAPGAGAPVVPKEQAKPPVTTPAPAAKPPATPPATPAAKPAGGAPPVAPKPAAQPPVVTPPAPKTGATQGSAAKGNGR